MGRNTGVDREARALDIPNEAVTPGNQCWRIKSQTAENEIYTVKVIDQQQNCSCSSQVCIHSLTCSCPDFCHRKVACKHIYKIVGYVKEKGNIFIFLQCILNIL